MLRMKPVKNAKQAEEYYAKSDGGYYMDGEELGREWGGKAATMLGLSGPPEFDHFRNLLHGLDPHTGKQLTAKLIEGRLAAWDVTASVPKGVTVALERGDERIQELIWRANQLAMGDLESYATTRVRKDGQQADRKTSNLVWYSVEHAETRPVEDKSLPQDHPWRAMPDMDRHIHNVIANVTYDEVEDTWKAVKYRPIMDLRNYFDRKFDHYLAGFLAGAGYEIGTRFKENGKYHTWDIKGIPDPVIKSNSRRSGEIEELEESIVAERQEKDATAPDRLSAVERDKLGATSRQQKDDDLTLAGCREFWDSRITSEEGDAIAETIRRAKAGANPPPEKRAEKAMDFAFRHHAEQQSVFRIEHLAATAMERSMGTATPSEIDRAIRQLPGVIIREMDGRTMVTTAGLQREEDFIVDFATFGQGKALPVGVAGELSCGRLNKEQWGAVTGLLNSASRVSMVQGPAGAGKSSMLGKFDEGMKLRGQDVTYLATTAKATEVLQKDGFAAHTLARFLLDERMQTAATGGRVVIDESSMLGHKDAYRLFALADKLDLTLILIGDPMQHGSVGRGATMRLLSQYGNVKPLRLTTILRQKDAEDARYLTAARLLSEGKSVEGFDTFDQMAWVKEMDDDTARTQAIAADYVQGMDELKAFRSDERVLVVSPTHAEAARITTEIRSRLREAGRLGEEEQEVTRLVAADASEAERGEDTTFRAGQVLEFHSEAGRFKKGQRITVTDPAKVPVEHADAFTLYRQETMKVAAGDVIRFTGRVKAIRREQTYKNGDTRTIIGTTLGGNLRLDDGCVIAADAGHFRHGYVETSFGSQGRTVQRVILGMSSASLGATNAEQIYVSSTRARQRLTLYTDDKEAVREAIAESSQKLVALDLRDAKPPTASQPKQPGKAEIHGERRRRMAVLDRARAAWERLTRQPQPQHHPQPERQVSYGRGR